MIQAEEILRFLDSEQYLYEWNGDLAFRIDGFCSLNHVKSGCITWAKNETRLDEIPEKLSENILIVGPQDIGTTGRKRKHIQNVLSCKEPKKIFFSILQHFFQEQKEPEICADSVILTKCIGDRVSIGHGCYIGKDVEIASGVKIGNHVQIEGPAVIGYKSIIHSGTIIGTDGFGYYMEQDQYRKVPHFGGVWIGKHVEIGSNTCIDRGTLDDTRIEDGVKIDNLCHIAHNVQIGKNSLIIACSMLGGSSRIGERGYVAPGAIIKNQVTVGENSVMGMGAVVTENIRAGVIAAGIPARILRENDGRL